MITRRTAAVGFGALAAAGAASPAAAQRGAGVELLPCRGVFKQGGAVIGQAGTGWRVLVDQDVEVRPSADGVFLIGLDRDAGPKLTVRAFHGAEPLVTRQFDIAPVSYEVQHVDGLPPETVTPTKPEIIERIGKEREKKTRAAASLDPIDNFKDGFVLPLEAPIRTSPFGVQRVLNGEPKQPHYGVDLAAPQGTPIQAPAPGLVVLAEPDMFLEGGLTMIDHGQGAITYYLHQSRLLVAAGQRVTRGQVIGEVGMKGRATGNHLCWRMSWRGRHMDPSLLIGMSASV